MAHYRKPLAAAAALNTAIFVVEAVAGFKADSLSLIMDSVHNLSDEMALVFLYLAFVLPHGISRHLLRSANVFNSVGLLSALLLWQAGAYSTPRRSSARSPSWSASSPPLPIGASRGSSSRRAATTRRSGSPIFTISATCTYPWRRSPPACWSA